MHIYIYVYIYFCWYLPALGTLLGLRPVERKQKWAHSETSLRFRAAFWNYKMALGAEDDDGDGEGNGDGDGDAPTLRR